MKNKPEKKQNELEQLLSELHIEGDRAEEMAAEILAGEAFLANQSEPEVPQALLAGIDASMRDSLSRQKTQTVWTRFRRYYQVAAMLAIAFMLSTVFMSDQATLNNHKSTYKDPVDYSTSLLDDENLMWELAIKHGDETSYESDSMALNEVMMLMDDDQPEVSPSDEPVGKENSHETDYEICDRISLLLYV